MRFCKKAATVGKNEVKENFLNPTLGGEQRKLNVRSKWVRVAGVTHFFKVFGRFMKTQPYNLLSTWKALCLKAQCSARSQSEGGNNARRRVCLRIVDNIQFLHRHPIHSLIVT